MSKEFKKIIAPTHTRYVIENATGGATGTAAVSSNTALVPGLRRRTPEAEQKVPQKPRQGPLRQQTGAGRHKDKKRDDKQGKAKHKKPYYEDHEVSMASNELKSIYADAKELLALVQKYGEQGDLEAWQQSKITKAADYLNSVLQSIGGEHRAELTELEKPSGTLYIILLKDRSESVRVVGDFATFPAEVQARASKVGLKDKEGRKERPLKVNFLMTSASQALAELDRALADVDFIGGEKAEFVFKNSAFDTDLNAEVNELLDLIKNGADERFAVYDDEKEVGNEPPRKLKGVDHYIVDPTTGEKRRVPKQGKPSSQMGGHSVEQPKTFTYTLKRTELGSKLRSMGFKVDGNTIVLSKQQRDQLLGKMGDQQFGQIFGQGGKFTEVWQSDPNGPQDHDEEDEVYMDQTVSDLHKEIYGFRPGKNFYYSWQDMSYDDKKKVYDKLLHLSGHIDEGRYNPLSFSGRMPATDRIPQDSTHSQNQQQAMVARMKQQTIDQILTLKPDWGQSDLELMSATELNQILRDIQFGGMKEAVKKPNATTRHLRDYPVSDKDVAKPVKKPEKKKPEQGVAEGKPDQLPTRGADYSKYDTDHLKTLLKPGILHRNEARFKALIRKELQKRQQQGMAEGSDKLKGTPVVSLSDFDNKDNTKNKYGQTVPKKLKKDDPRVKFHKEPKKKGVAEGSSYETDSMVSHISQIITDIYPQGGDKNTYMKLVAQKMPSIVKADPKLFRRAFSIAYDRFFHIGQDDNDDSFDYTDYSMRQGERGMEEGKIKGVDGKACWKGKRYAGKVKKADGTYKDKCVPVGEDAYTSQLLNRLDTIVNEKAPPGDKYERMVKHIKKGYSKDGKITDKERSIAYATAWKAKNKAKK